MPHAEVSDLGLHSVCLCPTKMDTRLRWVNQKPDDEDDDAFQKQL